MSLSQHLPKILIVGFLIGGIAVIVNNMTSGSAKATIVDVKMPNSLSKTAQKGQQIFTNNCAACHGENAAGSQQGPPLIHDIYNPGHHGDSAFMNAVAKGVQSHHWTFGNMPAQPQVSALQTKRIIQFIREVQVNNGIRYKKHQM